MTDTLSATPDTTVARPSRLSEFWFYFRENRGAVIGFYVFVAFVLVAAFAPLLAPYDPTQQFREHALQPPAWQDGGSWVNHRRRASGDTSRGSAGRTACAPGSASRRGSTGR